jgi:hypothetical protein
VVIVFLLLYKHIEPLLFNLQSLSKKPQKSPNMPLVVPGINSTSGDKAEEWQNKLIGKKLSDDDASTETVFAKRDLPQETRIIEPGMMVTKDFKEDRLNVHLKDDGTVSHVVKG